MIRSRHGGSHFYVTVLFSEGDGDRFASAQDALEYAEGEMHRLLAQHVE